MASTKDRIVLTQNQLVKIQTAVAQVNLLKEQVQAVTKELEVRNAKLPMQNMFLWYSKTAIMAYAIEKQLWFLLVMTQHKPMLEKGMATLETFKELQQNYKHWMMRQLFRELIQQIEIPADLNSSLDQVIKDRNYLIHHFPSDYFGTMGDSQKIESATRKLEEYHTKIVEVHKQFKTFIDEFQKR